MKVSLEVVEIDPIEMGEAINELMGSPYFERVLKLISNTKNYHQLSLYSIDGAEVDEKLKNKVAHTIGKAAGLDELLRMMNECRTYYLEHEEKKGDEDE